MCFSSLLKLDVTLTGLQGAVTVATMWEKAVVVEDRPISFYTLCAAIILGLLWGACCFYCVNRELRRGTLLLLPLAPLQPACLCYALVIIAYGDGIAPAYDDDRPCCADWRPVQVALTASMATRFLLCGLMVQVLARRHVRSPDLARSRPISACQVLADFGKGLLEWTGPASAVDRLPSGLSAQALEAIGVMCQGTQLLCVTPGSKEPPRTLFVQVSEGGEMLRWSWRDYVLLEEVYDMRVLPPDPELGHRGFSLHHGHDYNRQITLLCPSHESFQVWVLGLQAPPSPRSLGISADLRFAALSKISRGRR